MLKLLWQHCFIRERVFAYLFGFNEYTGRAGWEAEKRRLRVRHGGEGEAPLGIGEVGNGDCLRVSVAIYADNCVIAAGINQNILVRIHDIVSIPAKGW